MFNTISAFTNNIKRYSWLLVLPLIVGLFLSSCGDSPINAQTDFTDSSATNVNNEITFVPDQFDAVGTIQGTVIDKATGEALSGVAVSLLFKPAEADEPSVLTDTTDSEGTFAYTGVPVNTGADNYLNTGETNSPYTLKITTEDLDNYRDLYRYNAPLAFEGTGGDGAAVNLVSNVTIPLSELAVTLKGKAHTMADVSLSDVRVELYQSFNPIINGSGVTNTSMLIDSATTGSDGSFSFEGVEEKAVVMLRFVDDSDPSEVINYEYGGSIETPAGDGAKPEVNLGVINVSSSNESGAFYITNVTPQPSADISNLDTSFVYVFNRPVAENEYTRTDLGFGNNTIKDDIEFTGGNPKKAPGVVEFTVSWSSNRDSLIVIPEGLLDAHTYTLNVIDALDDNNFVDEYGNNINFEADNYSGGCCPDLSEEVTELDFSTNANNAKPHTPQLAADGVADVDFNSGTVEFSWDVDESAVDVKEYELWVKSGDDSYMEFTTFDRDDAAFNEFTTDVQVSGFGFPLVNLRGPNGDIPDEAINRIFKVRAISDNLQHGDFSNEITVSDNINPDITNAAYTTATGDTTGALTVTFAEPIAKSQAEDASNYTFFDASDSEITAEVASAEYNVDYDTSTYEVILTIADENSLSSGSSEYVQVTGVTDLAGNGMDTADSNSDPDDDDNNDDDSFGNEANY